MFIKQSKFSNNKNKNRLKLCNVFLFLLIILLGAIILSGSVSAEGLATSPQPKFHHDNNNTGQSQYKGPQTNATKWSYHTFGAEVHSSPAIGSDGTIYLGCDDDHLYALNPNGTKKWSYTGGPVRSSPAIGSDGTIYFGSVDNKLYALNSDGTKKWNYTTGGDIISSPAIGSDGTIYFGSWDGNLYALNPEGTKKWNYTTYVIDSSPAIGSDGTIYFGSYDSNLYALNPDGTKKWNYTTENEIHSSPAIGSDGTIYFGTYDGDFYALNPDGTKKWNYITGNYIGSSPAIGSDGTIYFGSVDGSLYALNPDGTKNWNYTTGNCVTSSPSIGSDGTIYFGSWDGSLYALNPDGIKKWKYYPGYATQTDSAPAIGSDGTIYFVTYNDLWAIADGLYASASPEGGLFNTTKTVVLSSTGTNIYYTTNGTDPSDQSTLYTLPLIINTSTILKYFADDLTGNTSPIYTENYVIDTVTPKAFADPAGGLYNSTQSVTLYMSEPVTSYFSLNGTDPTISGTEYTIPIIITATTILKYFAVDLAGNKSPVYTDTYTIDNVPPTASSNPIGGLYNSTKTVALNMNKYGTIYFTLNGSDPTISSSKYTATITITATTVLKYLAVDLAGNKSPIYLQTYTIDKTVPTASATLPGGFYNISKSVSLNMSKLGTIYYTLNNTSPTTSSMVYNNKPFTFSTTTILKYLAVDLAGNKSPIYTQIYTIDKIAPKISTTTPKYGATGISKTTTLAIKFSENIKSSTYYNSITIKNLTTGKTVSITNSISGTTLNIKTKTTRTANTWYQVTIPKAAIKDYVGNNLYATYTFKFKTGG
jgi:outer membrane protein assembly factor BamB